jgi:hypothetical protein
VIVRTLVPRALPALDHQIQEVTFALQGSVLRNLILDVCVVCVDAGWSGDKRI